MIGLLHWKRTCGFLVLFLLLLLLYFIRKGMGYEEYLREYAQFRRLKPEELLEILDRIHESTRGMKNLKQWEDYIEDYTEKLNEQAKRQRDRKEGVTVSTLHAVKGLGI